MTKYDVFSTFYEDDIEYKKYVNDIIRTLILNRDILNRIEKENNSEHSEKTIF